MAVHKDSPHRFAILLRGAAVLAFLLSPLACNRDVSDVVAPRVSAASQASVGSVITSDVVTITTVCGPVSSCHSSRAKTRIAQKVGPATNGIRAAQARPLPTIPLFTQEFDGFARRPVALGRAPPQRADGELKNVHVSGRTLSGDRIDRDGQVWHFEFTRDASANGKLSNARLYLNGQPVLATNSTWGDVAGTSYRRHSELTFYSKGKAAFRVEKSFTPVSIDPPSSAGVEGLSSQDLTIRAVFAPEEFPDGCPYEVPVCQFFQDGDPVPILNGIVAGLAWIATSVGNWFNSLWAAAASGEAGDASAVLFENAMATLEAINEPGLIAIATAIGAAARGPVTDTLMEEIASWIADWIWTFLMLGL